MTMFIFVGDMLVMAFMVCLAVWLGSRGTKESLDEISRIPLQDED
ncbi:MAG: hypothetical protein WD071_17180 [Pseudohongiella sp.]